MRSACIYTHRLKTFNSLEKFANLKHLLSFYPFRTVCALNVALLGCVLQSFENRVLCKHYEHLLVEIQEAYLRSKSNYNCCFLFEASMFLVLCIFDKLYL